MNRVLFTGTMVGKPEIEYTGKGFKIVKFEVLNKVGWGKYEANNRMKCVAFSTIAQTIHDYFQREILFLSMPNISKLRFMMKTEK